MTDITPFQRFQEEAAKSFGKELVQQVLGFMGDITRPPAKELGGLLSDLIKPVRLKIQFYTLRKTMELQTELGVQSQKVPLKILSTLLENCSWEEDENMQKRWAALLANAATLNEKTDNYATYVELLRQLSPLQAKCLDIIYNEESFPARRYSRTLPSYQSTRYLKESLNISSEELYILFDNLIRLNLIHSNFLPGDDSINPSRIQRSFDEVSLTYLGQNLVRKCKIPFSPFHRDKVEKVYAEVVEDIAKDRDIPQFGYFVSEVKKIYEYARESDIKSAILHALNETLWKGGSIKDFNDFPLKPYQKEEIIKITMEELGIAYS